VGAAGRLLTRPRPDCDTALRGVCTAVIAEMGSGVLAGIGPLVIATLMVPL
jgi:hypothetical protein